MINVAQAFRHTPKSIIATYCHWAGRVNSVRTSVPPPPVHQQQRYREDHHDLISKALSI